MKNIRKLKKYGTAVAGTALLVGATLTGAAATNHGGSSGSSTTLGDFPQPFVDDEGNVQSSIVVGEDAATADVVGAIDIAGVVGQDAFTTETVESGVSVDGKEYTTELRSNVVDDSDLLDKSDFSKLRRATVTDEEDTEHFVVERAGLDSDGNSGEHVSTVVNDTEALTQIDQGAVDYTVSYTPGFDTGDEVPLLGEEYEITSIGTDGDGNNQVELGSTVTQDQLGLDETYEHGPYTVKIEDFNQDAGSVLVQVSKDGEQLKMKGIDSDTDDTDGSPKNITVDGGDFTVNAESIYFGSQGNYISLSSTYTDTVLTEGEASPMDEDYDVAQVSISDSALQGVTLENSVYTSAKPENTDTEDDTERLTAGESFEGPAGYFQVNFEGLEDADTESISFSEDSEVSFTDTNGYSTSLNMNNLVSGNAITSVSDTLYTGVQDNEGNYLPLRITDITKDSGNITSATVQYHSFENTYVFDGSTDYKGASEATTAQERNAEESGSTINAGDVVVDSSTVSQSFVYEKDTSDSESDYTINSGNTGSMGVQGFGNFGSGSIDYDSVTITLDYQLDLNNGANITEFRLEGGGSNTDPVSGGNYINGDGQKTGTIEITGANLVSGTSEFDAHITLEDDTGNVTVDYLNYTVSNIDSGSADPGTLYTDLSKISSNLQTSDSEVEFETVSAGSGSTGQSTSTGYGFDLALRFRDSDGDSTTAESITVANSAAQVDTQYGAELSYDNTNSHATVTQENGETVDVSYNDGNIDEVVTSGTGVSDLTNTDDGDSTLTNYGSTVQLSGDSSASVTYPDDKREAIHAVGEVGAGEAGEGTVSTPAGWPEAGALDTEADTDQNLILVGGPAINDLTQDLAENNQTRSANEWQTGGYEGESILQLTEGFDGEGGNKALVVAGHGAEDTRTASEFLANYGDHSDALEGEDQVTISTETGNVVQ